MADNEEPMDHNAFDRKDCVMATAMLGIFPPALHFVCHQHDIPGAIAWALPGAVATLAVFVLSFILKKSLLSKIVNMAGIGITAVYLYYGYHEVAAKFERDLLSAPQKTETSKAE